MNHPEIDLLKLRNFAMIHKLKDEDILGPKGLNNVAELFGALTPFVSLCLFIDRHLIHNRSHI